MVLFDLSYWHATTKTYVYFGVFGFFRTFFRQKSDPSMVKSHFKNTIRPQKFPSAPIIPRMVGTLPIAQAHPDKDAYLTQNPAILRTC